jgi:hypothetical protein
MLVSKLPSIRGAASMRNSTLSGITFGSYAPNGDSYNHSFITTTPNDSHKSMALLHPNLFRQSITPPHPTSKKQHCSVSPLGRQLKGSAWPGKSHQMLSYQAGVARVST